MPQSLKDCPHERRPGTTVCLHCRHAERLAARAVRARIFTHVMLGGAIIGVVGVAVAAATAALDGRPAVAATAPATAALAAPTAAHSPAATATPAAAEQTAPVLAAALPASAQQKTSFLASATPASAEQKVPAPTSPAPAAPLPALYPMVPEGTSPLADDMSVHRRGDTVIVHFDTELGRTRRPEKFEVIVRTTLLQVYGAAAEPVLASADPGIVARQGDLLEELPARGVRIPTGDGAALSIWPVTRPGRDGPIVVSYRATVLPR